ncbi:MAG: aminotransferase class I/II-fold pyridoxal phosphate-dependent enzyme, partial [Ginsengibacter sp.]
FLQELTEYENLIVMHTLSKAWGLAALRLGLGFASEKIIDLFNKVKPPYNINQSSQQLGLHALLSIKEVNVNIKKIVEQREWVSAEMRRFKFIKKIFPSDSNFILVEVDDADKLYQYLLLQRIIVRSRTKEPLCENCIRITIGTKEENKKLINTLENYA